MYTKCEDCGCLFINLKIKTAERCQKCTDAYWKEVHEEDMREYIRDQEADWKQTLRELGF